MSQIAYRANLASGYMPFLSQMGGQTIIIPGKDQSFKNTVVMGSNDDDQDKGFPQLFYCHNVFPTEQGLQSVGFATKLNGLAGKTDFDDIFLLRDTSENKYLYSPGGGRNYIFDGNYNIWSSISPSAYIGPNTLVTVAFINGDTYIFFEKIGCFKYNATARTLDIVVLTGLIVGNIRGICAASGFLIAFDEFTVYRSQAVNPLDFTPDPSLGSGASIPEGLRGTIVVVLPIDNGFIIYTTKNAVSGTFSQNIRYPFNYLEVKGSAGILKPSHVAWESNTGAHYAWTQAGMQIINKSLATVWLPEVTDFLTSKIFEDFDPVTNLFTRTKITANFTIRVAIVGKRFVAISYGVSSLTHAIVYDIAQKRWGKLRIPHIALFEFSLPNMHGDVSWTMLNPLTWADLGDTTWMDLRTQVATFEQPKETFGVLQQDGTVKLANMDLVHTADDGVAILGKYQYLRERFIELDEIHVENVEQEFTNFDVVVFTSIDGKNTSQITTPYKVVDSGLFRQYNSSVNGKNHSIGYKGTFHLASMELKFHVGSRV